MDIERAMEQYMAGGIETTEQPHTTRVSEMVARYVQKFGSVRLHIFRIASSNDDLRRYLNTLRITLIRKGVQHSYLWQYDPSQNAYTVFLCHYDANTDAILQIVFRLWHGVYPLQHLNNIHIDSGNLYDTEAWLSQFVSSVSIMTPFYQHSYGYSKGI